MHWMNKIKGWKLSSACDGRTLINSAWLKTASPWCSSPSKGLQTLTCKKQTGEAYSESQRFLWVQTLQMWSSNGGDCRRRMNKKKVMKEVSRGGGGGTVRLWMGWGEPAFCVKAAANEVRGGQARPADAAAATHSSRPGLVSSTSQIMPASPSVRHTCTTKCSSCASHLTDAGKCSHTATERGILPPELKQIDLFSLIYFIIIV